MVLSFDPLDDYPLTPIHQWAGFDYTWDGQLDVALTVNPTSSAYPLDFRTRSQINRDALVDHPKPKVAGETLRQVMKLAQDRGGGKKTGRWIFSAQNLPIIDESE